MTEENDVREVDVAGLSIPAIGLGTMRQQGDACVALVEAALAEGYRHLDTARKYGNEAQVGAGLRRSSVARSDVVVTTKLRSDELEPDRVLSSAHDSLRQLGLDELDLLLVHWPNPDVPLADTIGAMNELVDEGSVRAIGVANFPSAMFREAAGLAELGTDQVEYHPYLGQAAVLDACRAAGAVLTAYCPLARAGDLLHEEVIRDIAAGHGRSPAQVVLRWLVQQSGVVAIPGASTVEHLRENLAADGFTLSDDDVAAMAALERGGRVVDPPHAPAWDAAR